MAIVKAMEAGQKQNPQSLVVIGGGYIGVEVASAALGWISDGLLEKVTIINMDKMLMQRVFSSAPEFPTFIEDRLKEQGKGKLEILNGCPIKGFEKDILGKVISVELANERSIPADIIVLGMGAKANTTFMPDKVKDARGYIKVDSSFSFAPDAYAFGDCASFPLDGKPSVLEHVAHARASAKHAALSAMGKTKGAYTLLPFFYSRILEYTDAPLIWNMWVTWTFSPHPNLQ